MASNTRGPAFLLDRQLLADMEAVGWRLPVIVRPAKDKASTPEVAHGWDDLRHCYCRGGHIIICVDLVVFECL